ncbi:hypothetical protein DSL72_004560 [Monilinia vaccinii-corymbosi]|uniref:Nuclear speckle splicing regulatory protein 1 N-terminal domain-containing protein n=1 Tax=Monilinia vaccinii-corymbosi TaxID=61207 RepID=A0A8A3NZJ8_9HELO|nr:hypothetical protein DSL72_004560 [Monilinia vaccinii-corymbosi]
MSGKGLSYGLNLTKKPSAARPPPPKQKPIFGGDDDSDEDANVGHVGIEEIGELGELPSKQDVPDAPNFAKPIPKKGPQIAIGSKSKLNPLNKAPISMYGDLSTSFTSKKHAETAEELDQNIYDYDAVYDSLKPKKKIVNEEEERKPRYMSNLIAAAAVRKRDSTIAEEKKLAREREAEGDEYADKEKFVTSAYKKQQEENRRLEEEERVREEEEERKNKGTGMTNFYKNMLERGEQKHAEVVKAAEERIKQGPREDSTEDEKTKTEAEIAREINEKRAGTIAVNDEGQVVDKRELLKSGLNVIPKAKSTSNSNPARSGSSMSDHGRGHTSVGSGGGKQAMRERQSRMMEAQLEQATKRALEEEEEERRKLERASKSRKTEGDILSAKERYLARKREAEEAKRRGN